MILGGIIQFDCYWISASDCQLPTSTLTTFNLIYFPIVWRFSSFFSGGKTTNSVNGRKLNECSLLLSFPLRIVNKGFGYGQWRTPLSPFPNWSLVQMPTSFSETTFLPIMLSFSAHHSKSINKYYRFVFIVLFLNIVNKRSNWVAEEKRWKDKDETFRMPFHLFRIQEKKKFSLAARFHFIESIIFKWKMYISSHFPCFLFHSVILIV